MKVVFYDVGKNPEIKVIQNNDQAFNELVGGTFCILQLDDDLAVIARQDLYEKPHPPNNRGFAGPFFPVKTQGLFSTDFGPLNFEESVMFGFNLVLFEAKMKANIRRGMESEHCKKCSHFVECHVGFFKQVD